jgi:glucose uptake protein
MLLVAAIAVAGLAVAFPVGMGTALVTGVIGNYILRRQGTPVLLFTGAAIIAGAIIVDAFAYRAHALGKLEYQIRTGKSKSTRKTVSAKAIVLSVASGLLMGSFFPLVDTARQGDPGLGPYSIGLVFAIGVFLSTFVFNLFFMNLPVEGEPLEMFLYLKGNLKQHLLGIAGGIISYTGIVASFAGASAPEKVQVGPVIGYAIGQGAAIVGALWGILVWREFAGADPRVRILLGVMLILFVCGLATVSLAPLFVTR